MASRTFTTILPKDMADKLDQMAKDEDRSKAWLIKDAIQSMLERREDRYQMIQKGLDDVRAGRVISDEEMAEWIENLKNNPY